LLAYISTCANIEKIKRAGAECRPNLRRGLIEVKASERGSS
jgi:hypothetical protein